MSVNIDIRGEGVRPTLKTSRMGVYLSDTGIMGGGRTGGEHGAVFEEGATAAPGKDPEELAGCLGRRALADSVAVARGRTPVPDARPRAQEVARSRSARLARAKRESETRRKTCAQGSPENDPRSRMTGA